MISVCLATYNGADVIETQLRSILSQLGAEDEVIVSDDGSTDATLDVVRALRSPIVRIVAGPRRGTPIANFENALRQAQGDIIFLADQDDEWMPQKVERTLAALQTADLVVSDCIVTDGALREKAPSFFALNHTRQSRLYNLLVRNGYVGCCMAFRRNVLERALPFPPHTPMHDIWLGNVAAYHFRVRFISDRLIRFRRTDHNTSATGGKSPYSLRQKLMFRIRVVIPLLRMLLAKER